MNKSLWSKYQVEWNFVTKLCGSVPGNPDIVQNWLDARAPRAVPPGGRSIPEIQEEVFSTIAVADEERELQEARSLLVFQKIDGHLVMRAGTVRAHLKDCARIFSREYTGKIKGEVSFSTRIINCVYPDPTQYWVPILRDGEPIIKADDTYDKPVHTFRGNALKTIEYVMGAQMRFTLQALGTHVRESDLEMLMEYGGVHGYAGERGDGEGKYISTITKID